MRRRRSEATWPWFKTVLGSHFEIGAPTHFSRDFSGWIAMFTVRFGFRPMCHMGLVPFSGSPSHIHRSQSPKRPGFLGGLTGFCPLLVALKVMNEPFVSTRQVTGSWAWYPQPCVKIGMKQSNKPVKPTAFLLKLSDQKDNQACFPKQAFDNSVVAAARPPCPEQLAKMG